MDIVIFDHTGTEKITVTALQGSIANASLMTSDYIQIKFVLASPKTFEIGDYCKVALVKPSKWWEKDDGTYYLLDINGNSLFDSASNRLIYSDGASTPVKYIVTKRTTPTYNTTTGGWEYTLQLDAWYYSWNRYILKLNPNMGAVSTTFGYTNTFIEHLKLFMIQLTKLVEDGDDNISIPSEIVVHYIVRKEVSGVIKYREKKVWYEWNKDYRTFEKQLEQEDTQDIDQYSMQASCLVSDETKYISYDSEKIIDALNRLCSEDAYNCEWWMQGDVLHFGRCEQGTSITIENDKDAVLSASPSSGEYATRIIAFGSTTNVPARYRKTLKFSITDQGTTIGDRTRPMTANMFSISDRVVREGSLGKSVTLEGSEMTGDVLLGFVVVEKGQKMQFLVDYYRYYFSVRSPGWETDIASIYAAIEESYIELSFRDSIGSDIDDYDRNAGTTTKIKVKPSFSTDRTDTYVNINVKFETQKFDVPKDDDVVYLYIVLKGIKNDEIITRTKLSTIFHANFTNYKVNSQVKVLSGSKMGQLLNVTINPDYASPGTEESCKIEGLESLSYGDTYQFVDGKVDEETVPVSYYTDDFGNATIASYERRLMLPAATCPNNYIDLSGTDPEKIVEITKVFEDIYPKMDLPIERVKWAKIERVTNTDDDGTQYYTYPVRFSIFIKKSVLDFKSKYIVADKKLECQFQNGTLAGYTFELQFMPDSKQKNTAGDDLQEYKVVISNINGINIPNEKLYPVGLENDMISNISPSIKDEGTRSVVKSNTCDHIVLLNYNAKAITSMGLVSQAEQELYRQAKAYLDKVSKDESTYTAQMFHTFFEEMDTMPGLGQKVGLVDAGLFGGTRQTRIIGYEIPIDIPIDHPKYTIGESPRYSRLAAIEKQQTTK